MQVDEFIAIKEEPKTQPQEPHEFTEFQKMGKYEKIKEGEKFYGQPFIMNYRDDKWKVELYNRDTFLWLYELYSKETNGEKSSAYIERLKIFQNAIINQVNPYLALLIDFKKYPFKDSQVSDGEVSGWDD